MDNLIQTANLDVSPVRIQINSSYDLTAAIVAHLTMDSLNNAVCDPATSYEAPNLFVREVSSSGGMGNIGGVATSLGEPFCGVVLLYDEDSKELVASTLSEVNGVFLFKNLNLNKRYFVVGINPDITMNHSIRAHLQPIP